MENSWLSPPNIRSPMPSLQNELCECSFENQQVMFALNVKLNATTA
jgi:hypothetical protein